MQAIKRLPVHARVVALALLAALVLLLLLAVAWLGTWYWQEHQEVVSMEPRVARLLGYRDSEAELRAASEAARASLEGLVIAQDAAAAGAAVQQQVRRILEDAGLGLVGSQVVESVKHEALEEIRVKVSVSGSMEAFDQALVELARARPLLLIDSLRINPVNVRRGEALQLVNVELSFKAVRIL